MSNSTQKLINNTREINNRIANTKTIHHTTLDPHPGWMATQACLHTYWLGFSMKEVNNTPWMGALERETTSPNNSKANFHKEDDCGKRISIRFTLISRRWSVAPSLKKGFLKSQHLGLPTVQSPTIPNAVWRVLLSFHSPGIVFSSQGQSGNFFVPDNCVSNSVWSMWTRKKNNIKRETF